LPANSADCAATPLACLSPLQSSCATLEEALDAFFLICLELEASKRVSWLARMVTPEQLQAGLAAEHPLALRLAQQVGARLHCLLACLPASSLTPASAPSLPLLAPSTSMIRLLLLALCPCS
jgi:hypothetical protein